MTSRIDHTTIDCHDAYALSTFWAQVLGFTDVPGDPNEPGHEECMIIDPSGGQKVLFIEVPEDKRVKNRVHFDLVPADFPVAFPAPDTAVSGGRTSDGYISGRVRRFAAGVPIWIRPGIDSGDTRKSPLLRCQSSDGSHWDGKPSSGSVPSVWYMPSIFKCSSTACFT